MIYKASAAWLSKRINCTLEGILTQCHGCCESKFYPCTIPEQNVYNHCFWLGDKGCKLNMDEEPVLCMLYPIIFNDNHTMILFARSLFQSCKKTYKQGEKSILENQSNQIIHIFGQEFYDLMYKSIIVNQKDFYFEMPRYVLACIAIENLLETMHEIPMKRTEYEKRFPEYFTGAINITTTLSHNPKVI